MRTFLKRKEFTCFHIREMSNLKFSVFLKTLFSMCHSHIKYQLAALNVLCPHFLSVEESNRYHRNEHSKSTTKLILVRNCIYICILEHFHKSQKEAWKVKFANIFPNSFHFQLKINTALMKQQQFLFNLFVLQFLPSHFFQNDFVVVFCKVYVHDTSKIYKDYEAEESWHFVQALCHWGGSDDKS